jgi:hypothetical protein
VSGSPPWLPKRVLAVRTTKLAQVSEDEVKLVSVMEPRRSRYVALSYVWGRPSLKRMTTTQENLTNHLSGIKIRELPATFQDAVTVVKALGASYLWIDALCIIQDDPMDKGDQIAQLGNIYRNSTITIAAACAPDSHTHFLQQRLPSKHDFNLPLSCKDLSGVMQLRSSRSWSTSQGHIQEPIQSRGWCFQERILSPRMVFFDSAELVWNCNTLWTLESLPLAQQACLKFVNEFEEFAKLKNELFGLGVARTKLTSDGLFRSSSRWYKAVDSYRCRDFNFPEDALIAISAIARHFSKVSKWKYAAGLWEEDLCRGLSWHRASRSAQSTGRAFGYKEWRTIWSRDESYRLPTKETTKELTAKAPHANSSFKLRSDIKIRGEIRALKLHESVDSDEWEDVESDEDTDGDEATADITHAPSWSWAAGQWVGNGGRRSWDREKSSFSSYFQSSYLSRPEAEPIPMAEDPRLVKSTCELIEGDLFGKVRNAMLHLLGHCCEHKSSTSFPWTIIDTDIPSSYRGPCTSMFIGCWSVTDSGYYQYLFLILTPACNSGLPSEHALPQRYKRRGLCKLVYDANRLLVQRERHAFLTGNLPGQYDYRMFSREIGEDFWPTSIVDHLKYSSYRSLDDGLFDYPNQEQVEKRIFSSWKSRELLLV